MAPLEVGTIVRTHCHYGHFMAPSTEPCPSAQCPGTQRWAITKPVDAGGHYAIKMVNPHGGTMVVGATYWATLTDERFEVVT